MRKLMLVCGVLLPLTVSGAPFLTSDPDPTRTADKCVYQNGTAAAVVTPLVNNACNADLAGITTGTSNLQVWFRNSTWGVDSAKVPFALTKPAAGFSGPTNIQVTP